MALDTSKVPADVLGDIQERGHTLDQISRMSPEEAFSEYCNWNGLIGYGHSLFNIVHSLTNAGSSR